MTPDPKDSGITINLLDPVRGLTIQSWEFDGVSQVRIGRAETNDVVLTDMLVSREHSVLTMKEGRWSILALGRNGIILDGRPTTGETPLPHAAGLRLGTNGPTLEFRVGRKRASFPGPSNPATSALERDEEKKLADRTDVTEVDLRQRMQQEARKLQREQGTSGRT